MRDGQPRQEDAPLVRLLPVTEDQRRQSHRQVLTNRLPGFLRHLQRRLLEHLHFALINREAAESCTRPPEDRLKLYDSVIPI